jgi:hypothetical protein
MLDIHRILKELFPKPAFWDCKCTKLFFITKSFWKNFWKPIQALFSNAGLNYGISLLLFQCVRKEYIWPSRATSWQTIGFTAVVLLCKNLDTR